MKIIITGFSGFIGYHLCNRIFYDQKYKVTGVDNFNNYYDPVLKKDRFKILKPHLHNHYNCDISNQSKIFEIIDYEKPDIIIHLAAQAGVRYSLENPQAYFESNLQGFFNILEACRIFKINKLIFASSSSVYGNNKKDYFSENDFVDNPLNFYAASKKSNELMAYSYSNLYKIIIVGLRFFTVYGPFGRPDMSYYKFTNNILNGKYINVFGKGEMYRDFTYVDDITNGIFSLIETINTKFSESSVPYNIFNIGNNNPVKLTYFISLIEKALGIKAKKNYLDFQQGEAIKTAANISKIQKFLNFNPTTKIEDGIPIFVKWFKEYHNL